MATKSISTSSSFAIVIFNPTIITTTITFPLLILLTSSLLPLAISEDHSKQRDYCIIGAGPSGLQYGKFLEDFKRDYVVFERNNVSGSFYVKYPRHRKLISINKRFTGSTNKEFNLRHDWNSLINDDKQILFTNYSKDYFPEADILLKYLDDFRRGHNINVQFNTEIRNLQSLQKDGCRFHMNDQNDNGYCCKEVYIANGVDKPIIPNMKGAELMVGYEEMSTNPEDYAGKSIMILGRGNSGLETAKDLYGWSNFIHLVARTRIKFSWETHYVGDIRGVNNEVLDAYMLKSLDGLMEVSAEDIYLVKHESGKILLRADRQLDINQIDHNPVRDGYDVVLRCLGFTWDDSFLHNDTVVPRADKQKRSKYPKIDEDFQSKEHPGMFVLGVLTHSLDYRKSAGGFIHGFRYTARTLFRIRNWENHGVPWPSVTGDYSQLAPTILKRANEGSGIYQMFQFLCDVFIIDREKETFTQLDEFPLNLIPRLGEKTGHSFEDGRHQLLVLTMEYGANFSNFGTDHFGDGRARGSVDDAHQSNFLHPVLNFYRKLPTQKIFDAREARYEMPKGDAIIHTLEDFTTMFDGPTTHVLPIRRFLEFILEKDLRTYLAESCIEMALTHQVENVEKDLPLSCVKYLSSITSIYAFDV